MTGHHYLSPSKRDAAIKRLLDHVRGGGDAGEVFDDYPGLDFGELEASVAGKIRSAGPAERHSLHFDLALLRSLRYSVASSKHCLVLGAVNGIRMLYEGVRLVTQSDTDE